MILATDSFLSNRTTALDGFSSKSVGPAARERLGGLQYRMLMPFPMMIMVRSRVANVG